MGCLKAWGVSTSRVSSSGPLTLSPNRWGAWRRRRAWRCGRRRPSCSTTTDVRAGWRRRWLPPRLCRWTLERSRATWYGEGSIAIERNTKWQQRGASQWVWGTTRHDFLGSSHVLSDHGVAQVYVNTGVLDAALVAAAVEQRGVRVLAVSPTTIRACCHHQVHASCVASLSLSLVALQTTSLKYSHALLSFTSGGRRRARHRHRRVSGRGARALQTMSLSLHMLPGQKRPLHLASFKTGVIYSPTSSARTAAAGASACHLFVCLWNSAAISSGPLACSGPCGKKHARAGPVRARPPQGIWGDAG